MMVIILFLLIITKKSSSLRNYFFTEPEFVEAPITRISDSEIQQIVEKLQINSKTTALPPNVKENRQKMLQVVYFVKL